MDDPGIKSGYPLARKYFGRLVDYVMLTRPFTILPAFIAGCFGVMIQLAWDGTADRILTEWATIVYVGITLMLGQAVGQIFNNAADVGPDKMSKPYRPVANGRVSVNEAMGLGLALTLIAVGRALTLGAMFGAIVSVILFMAIFYNLEPIRAKRWFPWNLMWMATSRGVLPFLATWSLFGDIADPLPWILGTFTTLWVINWQAAKDFPDVEADRAYQIKTLPVKYGAKRAARYMVYLSPIPFAFLWVMYELELVQVTFLLLFLLVPVAVLNCIGMFRTTKYLENNITWAGMYIGLAMIYILAIIAISLG
ncbi:MAG: UbiA prenyltransferase family protein [Dehalococcoidales bacterium]|jgi:4-hydroxybenzoate polyprenyltransferase|nr:UbiA prenyltransferase family protein [Dehalococcoidales bacterium]